MALSLVPHAATTPDRLRCWVGIADVDVAPALAWRLNGAAVAPEAKRPLTPVLAGPLAARARATAFTGFFELRDLQPDTRSR